MPFDIEDLSHDELMALNDLIIERLRFLERAEAHEAMIRFHPGERVSFESPQHGLQQGTLVKFNQKTVSVLTDDGRKWTVAPQFLSAIKKPPSPVNVIDINKKKFEPPSLA